ncbi:hypothetical protein [Synechococcus sp. Tobar12-5m-g]|jgi:hypothetical protein|nr:hypothetical protein [Synechococcus sp. Tobar12-5m-g]
MLHLTATVKSRHPAMVRAAWIDGLVAEQAMTFRSGALQAAVLAFTLRRGSPRGANPA